MRSAEFDEFLYAPIAEERSGMLLSMLSALARMNLDPWDEAARLARLPRATATSFLTKLIAALPDGPSPRTNPGAVAERLIDLLPRRPVSQGPLSTAQPKSGVTAALVVYLALLVLLLINQWLAERASPASAPATSLTPPEPAPRPQAAPPARPRPDLSGRSRAGIASFYAANLAGRTMADGNAMDPQGNNAASRTLPLGTTAKVTNVETGQSAIVTIQDRGPYVTGRIVDLSPRTAGKIGITQDKGIAQVQVAPISVPLPDGSLRRGVAAAAVSPIP
jgi:rare lipoprotein A